MITALAASCTNTIEMDISLPEKRIIMNAMLSTEDEIHAIYLSERTDNRNDESYQGVENIYGAKVTCHVNGELVAVAEEYTENDNMVRTREIGPYEGAFGKSYYWFRAAFKPGDKIRIEAEKGNRKVCSEVTVPKPARMEFLGMTSSVMQINEWESKKVFNLDLRIEDVAGQNTYYRVGNPERAMDLLFRFHDSEGNKTKDDVVSRHSDSPDIYIENDPVLNDGYMPGSTDEIFGTLNPVNTFRIFSDAQFRDKDAVISMSVEQEGNNYGLLYIEEGASEVEVSPTLRISIESLTFETYNYYKALNAGETFGYDISFLMEPIIFPANVTGGLGFVGISSGCIIEIPLPEFTFRPGIYA